jgi:hypothetical protein
VLALAAAAAAAAAATAAASCTNLLGSDSYGTVRAQVRDNANAPVPGVRVAVSETNSSGGAFSVSQLTTADGTTTLGGIQTGSRSVTVTPPAGYTAGADPLSKVVTVESGRTVEVSFVVTRSVVLTIRSGVLPVLRTSGRLAFFRLRKDDRV